MSTKEPGGLGRLFRRARRDASDDASAGPPPRPDEAAQGDEAAAEAERRDREAERLAREAELLKLPLWTDSHCHLQYAPDDEAAALIVSRAVEKGVRRMVCVGTDAASSERAIALAAGLSRAGSLPVEVYATVGLHPHDAKAGLEAVTGLIASRRAPAGDGGSEPAARIVAVGECGLDYHYDHSPRTTQRAVFAAQVALANEHDLALVIHTREAFDDTLAVLSSEGVPARTIFHCFTGGPSEAERCLAVGAYLSFSGIATFNNAGEVRESVGLCPLDRLLIETDAPFLTPVPYRGKQNEPAFVPIVGEAVASQKGLKSEELAELTSANAVAAFRLAPA